MARLTRIEEGLRAAAVREGEGEGERERDREKARERETERKRESESGQGGFCPPATRSEPDQDGVESSVSPRWSLDKRPVWPERCKFGWRDRAAAPCTH